MACTCRPVARLADARPVVQSVAILRARLNESSMPVIAVVNRKGGSGKSTLATHLAGYLADAGQRVMLGDVDRQQSTQTWLRCRAARTLPRSQPIVGWAVDPKSVLRPPAGVTHVVLDTPGGLRGFELAKVVSNADAVLIPVCNSIFDRESAADCFAELMALPRVASGRCKVAAVGMRLDGRTRAGEVLAAWATALELPFIGVLRDTQVYVRCVERGLTIFDLPAAQAEVDRAQWRPILDWLAPVMLPAPAAEAPVVRPTRPCTAAPAPRPQTRVAQAPAASHRGPVPVSEHVSLDMLEGPQRRSLAVRLGEWLGVLPARRRVQRGA
jgi:chromosome partitioning protein